MPVRTAGRRPSSIRRAALRRRELSCLIAAVLASGAFVEQAVAREVPFDARPALSTSAYRAIFVSSADIDGDGDLDALGATVFGDEFVWYENTAGDGSAWSAHTISTTADGAFSIRGVDIDEDGDLDVLVAERDDAFVGWYENTNGDGSAWAVHTITASANTPKDAVSADVDGDGDIDALAVLGDGSVTWYENTNGDGSTWTTHAIAPVLTHDFLSSADAADMDGDGDIDMLFVARHEDLVAWYENTNGDGSSWSIHTITTTAAGATSAVASDVDGDGDLDVFAASFDDDTITWHENTSADGSTWTTHDIHTTADGAISVFAADIDGDGDVDVATSAHYGDRFDWHENVTGDGSSWSLHTVTTDFSLANGAYFLHAADLDGDGDFDLLSAGGRSDTFAWYRNDTIHRSALFTSESTISTVGNAANFAAATDLDNDGDLDVLATARFGPIRAYWHENDGSAGGWTVATISASGDSYAALSVDVDGDGDLDVVLPSSSDGNITWHENDGSGGGWTVRTIATSSYGARSLDATDIDNDGDLDIVSASRDINTVAWHENDGSGSAWTTHDISTTSNGAFTVSVGDIDGDGDVDVISGTLFADSVFWHENDGVGAGWAAHTITLTTDGTRSVFAVDMDLDGDTDVLTASSSDNEIEWYENDSLGGTWTRHLIFTMADTPDRVEAWDLDSDGDLDVISASNFDDTIAWHENTGNATNWIAHTISVSADSADWASAGDLDGDGDLDVLSASSLDDKVAWYENQGGQFALPTLDIAQKIVNNSSTHDLLDIEAVHRGRTGDSDAELVTLELKLTDGAGVDLISTEANNLIEELRVYLDDGSGAFEAGSDTVIHTISSFSVTAGVQTVIFGEGNANAQLPFGSPKVYFVVADLTADADSQTPSAFQVGHLTESSSSGEDAPNDIPLTLEFWPNTGTGVVDTALSTASCKAPFDLQLANRTVTTTVACEAGTLIRAGDAFVVGSGGDLSLSAGQTIRFTSGFHVDTGTLTVTIDPLLAP